MAYYMQENEKQTRKKKCHEDVQQKSHRPHARLTTITTHRLSLEK